MRPTGSGYLKKLVERKKVISLFHSVVIIDGIKV